MKISQTTKNMATKRNLELVIENQELWIYDENDSEPILIYSNKEDGLFLKHKYIKEEDLPCWIKDEKGLKKLIKYLPNAA